MKNLHIIISGKVYKVGFRYFVKQMAENLGILGTVKYCTDHSVLIKASGNDNSLNKFISFCRLGCIGSQVENISISESNSPPSQTFEIITENEENPAKNTNYQNLIK